MAYFVVMLLAYQYLIILLFHIAVLKLYVLFEAMNQKNEVQDVMMMLMLTYSSPLAPFYTKKQTIAFYTHSRHWHWHYYQTNTNTNDAIAIKMPFIVPQ